MLLTRERGGSGVKIRLYLDGLDEIPDPEKRRKIVQLMQEAAKSGNGSQIVTCRDYIFAPWLKWIHRLSLKGFGDPELKQLVSQWMPIDSGEGKAFFEELDRSKSLKALTRTPLLATLIILVFRQTGQLPESEVRLYEMFTDLLCEGWNLAKRVLKTSKFGTQIKKNILRQLARKVHEDRQKQFAWKNINAAITSRISMEKDQVAELGDELVSDGILSRNGNIYEFAHLSFQEFLTAKEYLGDPNQKGIRRAVRAFLRGDRWWIQVIRFYFGLSGNPEELSYWLSQQAERVSRGNEFAEEAEIMPEFDVDDMHSELERMLASLYPKVKYRSGR